VTAGLKIIGAGLTDKGRRAANDDVVLVDPSCEIYAVFDGARGRFGGHTAAEVAHQVVTSYLAHLEAQLGPTIGPQTEHAIDEVLTAAHQRILEAQVRDPTQKGIASTVAMVTHREDKVMISHVGDSRVYLYRALKIYQVTQDHNVENYLKKNPSARAKIQASPKTLVRALGVKSSSFSIDHRVLTVEKNDWLMICSDGLTDSIPNITLRAILASSEIYSAEEVAACLIRSALAHGSMDNISAVVLHVTDRAGAGPATTVFDPRSLARPEEVDVLGWLTFLEGRRTGEVLQLEASMVIGFDPECQIVLEGDFVSRRHAEILRTEHGFLLRDLGSTNGTYVNNIRTKGESLVDGDRVRIGISEMLFKCHVLDGDEVLMIQREL